MIGENYGGGACFVFAQKFDDFLNQNKYSKATEAKDILNFKLKVVYSQ